MRVALAAETATAALSDTELATNAGVPEIAITSFRAGIPHWSLERPGVADAIAREVGIDVQQFRATIRKAKLEATTARRTTQGPTGFGGSFSSLRG